MSYCNNCHETLAPTARFCPSCGEPTGDDETLFSGSETILDEEETRVGVPQQVLDQRRVQTIQPRPVRPLSDLVHDEGERTIFSVRPTLLFVQLGYLIAALFGILLIALAAFLDSESRVPLYLLIPLALAFLLVPAFYHFKRNMLRYTLTDSKIEIDEGFISRTTRNIPLSKVQDVTVKATVLQRVLRFGDLVVDNSGAEGGVIVFRNIPDPRRHADMLLRELRRRE